MNGLIWGPISVENTANPGQLQSITDTVPYHKCGQVYVDNDGNGYIYAKNGVGSALTANAFGYGAQPFYLATSGVDWNMQVKTITDLGTTAHYVVVPQVAIPSLYYGWVKFKGGIASLTGCVNETRVVGDQLICHDATALIRAVATQTSGLYYNAFAIVTTANTVSATTCTACRLIGRECIGTT